MSGRGIRGGVSVTQQQQEICDDIQTLGSNHSVVCSVVRASRHSPASNYETSGRRPAHKRHTPYVATSEIGCNLQLHCEAYTDLERHTGDKRDKVLHDAEHLITFASSTQPSPHVSLLSIINQGDRYAFARKTHF